MYDSKSRIVGKSLRRRRRFRRKKLERKRGRILSYNVGDMHDTCAYLSFVPRLAVNHLNRERA